MPSSRRCFTPNALLCALLTVCVAGCGETGARVVLYSAQDQEFATAVIEKFRQETGLPVAVKYDTEKDKSVSLYRELIHEKTRPRCDVFWNNEVLATIQLARQGLLAPYDSPSRVTYPRWARAEGSWTPFAQRARVLVVNTDHVPEADRPRSLLDLVEPRWRGRVAMAKPLHGTALTQAVCLFQVIGGERAQGYYRGLKANGIKVAPGNKQVAEWVGAGSAAVGVTDTDDAMAEVEAGHPVAIVFPDGGRKAGDPVGTLFIPNTLAIIQGCPNQPGAQRLVDFLLGPEVESSLARSASHQIPVNPAAQAALPTALAPAATAHRMDVDWQKAADLWEGAQHFLRQEFAAGD
jgi:iron(III) transport system substrate-binding protein